MIMALLCASLASGCSSPAQSPDMEIHGAWDVIRLGEAAAADFSLEVNNDTSVSANGSSTSIDDLKKGLCDAVILGREPASAELIGLQDHVIAYDAICIIIDNNSYAGWSSASQKMDGLKELTFADLVSIASVWSAGPNQAWQWKGFFKWQTLRNASTGDYEIDTIKGVLIQGWAQTPKQISFSLVLLPGKYDSQRSLYDSLGINEQQLAEIWSNKSMTSFTAPDLKYEEEVVAWTYRSISSQSQYLGFASRRVTLLALGHAPVKVIAINGIDPIENTQAIYNGTYPLRRKIHLLTADNASGQVKNFVQYILSEEGQKVVENAGFLPLHNEESAK